MILDLAPLIGINSEIISRHTTANLPLAAAVIFDWLDETLSGSAADGLAAKQESTPL
jgi:hypothetical protein